ncbi:MAG: AmmeMemoRadiSam system radical SAM enzyme [Deltaproteobacteria bacterium]|nr:AmmeMemoRadiSam system radical SAM enzyme [Deltaproteobacteria bacterium]
MGRDNKASINHEARWWRTDGDRVVCELCPRTCEIGDGQSGFCFIRKNEGGRLIQAAYGRSTGFAVDPIEKKPLNNFYPGTPVLSFGTAGCNLGCKFCQNWSISKARLDNAMSSEVSPDEVVALAERQRCPAIAYTYNDPVIWAEYVIDVARIARSRGIKNVLVTAGYVTERARGELYEFVDAVNVDLKAFTEEFYRKTTLSHIEPVKETLRWLVHETNVWTEITTLLIPGLNDSDDEVRALSTWVASELGLDVPVHFTAFHPDFKMTDRPPTPAATLTRARRIACETGLRYVYVGNVHDIEGETTYCPACGVAVIERDWHAILSYRIDAAGRCAGCGKAIAGHFDPNQVHRTSGRRHILGLVH